MKKLLLALTLGTSIAASAQTVPPSVTLNWSDSFMAYNNATQVQSTAFGATILDDGSFLGALTNYVATEIKVGESTITISNDDSKSDPSNLTIARFNADGTLKWSMSSSFGMLTVNSNSKIAVVPNQDLAAFAFVSGFNTTNKAPTETSEVIFKITDTKGEVFTVPMECPSAYRPKKGIVLFFKPSDGSIVALKSIESVYTTNVEDKYKADPITLASAVATADAIYVTGSAMTKTTFADGVVFTPAGVPADWNGSADVSKPFTVKYDLAGVATKVVDTTATTEASEKNQLIGTDGNVLYVVGNTSTSVYGFMYDKDLNKMVTLNFPLSLNEKDNKCQIMLNQINVTDNDIFVTGAIKGGFEGTNLSSSPANDTFYHGFVAQINRTTGKIVGGYVDPLFISGYFGCYEIGNKYFMPAYEMRNANAAQGITAEFKAYLRPCSKYWTACEELDLMTSAGSISMWPSAYDSESNKIIVAPRCNKPGKFGDTDLSTGITAFSSLYVCYTIDAGSGVDNVIANGDQVTIAGGNGCINITATAPTQVNIYNLAGICVKSVNVDGETSVAVAPGFYIAAGKKVAVK